jgi:cytochrome P450
VSAGPAPDDYDRWETDHLARLAEVRRQGPIAWVPELDAWVVTTRELASVVMRDAHTFTVDDPRFATAQVVGPSMLSLDGEAHRRHRDPFVDAFRPASVHERFAEVVDHTAHALVEELRPNGTAELRRELAGPLAVSVVALSLGIDGLPAAQLQAWYDRIVEGVTRIARGEPAPEAAAVAFGDLGAALDTAMGRSGSLLAEVRGHLERDEVVSNAAVFLFGGIETSEGMTASALAHLLGGGHLARVRADRTLVDVVVEESLRLEPAAARVDRYATADVDLAGAAIRRGDLVIVSLTAAGRDPKVFPRPDVFDLRRDNVRQHLAFAHGPHACIGAQLARLETRAAIHAVLDALPSVRLLEPVETRGAVFRKPVALRVAWDVG